MGVDFVRKAAHSFHKGLDRRRIELCTPDLFSQQPTSSPRTYVATFRRGATLDVGDKLGVRLEGGQVVGLRGLDRVAIIERPPPELVTALSVCFGEAWGLVQHVHRMAHVVEISVC